jgi:CheY-like chemotaxis protein
MEIHHEELGNPVPLVDDEEALAELGRRMLERLGYSVAARTRSVEALEVFKAEPDHFDLIICDYTMPGMTGADLAKEAMRIRPDNSGHPVFRLHRTDH